MDSSTSDWLEACCSLRSTAIFFSFWTLTHGIAVSVMSFYAFLYRLYSCLAVVTTWCYFIYQLIDGIREDDRVLIICHLTTLFALIDIVAGILMLIGLYKVRKPINVTLYVHLIPCCIRTHHGCIWQVLY